MLKSPEKGSNKTSANTASETFGVYIQKNEPNAERSNLIIEVGMTVNKVRKAAAKQLKMKTVKRLFLSSGHEVKFVDELKQDAELFASSGEDYFKSKKDTVTEEFNISILGSGGVGKSALTLRFIRGIFVNQWDPTVEDAYSKAVTVDDKTCRLKILDTAGQDNFESMRPHWLKEKQAYVFVYSLTSEQSFKELDRYVKLHEEINAYKKIPIVLAANKVDLIRKDASCRKVTEDAGKLFAKRMDALYVETSALTSENVAELFDHLVRKCRKEKKDVKPFLSRCSIS